MKPVARRYDTAEVCEFVVDGGQITEVRRVDAAALAENIPWIAPAFFDIQTNGYGGQEFSSPTLTVDYVAEIVAAHENFGVSRLLPTVTTGSLEVMAHGLRTIAAARKAKPELAKRIPGIHLEGPYLSPQDGPRGAHPLEHIHSPDWSEFEKLQMAAEGLIRMVTLSPDYPQAAEFIRLAVASGIVIAIGHTAANSEQVRAAVDAGASLSTHLGNGAHRMLPRHPNYLWDQLGEDRLSATLIADGHHLPPEVLRSMVRAKEPQRCILISDLSGLAGLPPGIHHGELCDVEVCEDGRLLLAGQDPTSSVKLLAGASRPIGDGIGNMVRWAGVDLKTAVEMATFHPAELLGMPSRKLAPGEPADFVLFTLDQHALQNQPALKINATILNGRKCDAKK